MQFLVEQLKQKLCYRGTYWVRIIYYPNILLKKIEDYLVLHFIV